MSGIGGLCIVYISEPSVTHVQVVSCPPRYMRFYYRVDLLSKDFVLHMTDMCGRWGTRVGLYGLI